MQRVLARAQSPRHSPHQRHEDVGRDTKRHRILISFNSALRASLSLPLSLLTHVSVAATRFAPLWCCPRSPRFGGISAALKGARGAAVGLALTSPHSPICPSLISLARLSQLPSASTYSRRSKVSPQEGEGCGPVRRGK